MEHPLRGEEEGGWSEERDVPKSQNALLGARMLSISFYRSVCILRTHVREAYWEEAAEDRAGTFLAITTVALFAFCWVFLG